MLGAGTGRLAAPLAQSGRHVVAVDNNFMRLRRIKKIPGLSVLCADLRSIPQDKASAALFPYSTINLIAPADIINVVSNAVNLVDNLGTIWFDTSTNFEGRSSFTRKERLRAICPEFGGEIVEWEEATSSDNSWYQKLEWTSNGVPIAREKVCWYKHSTSFLLDAVVDAGATNVSTFRGYGTSDTRHRVILRAQVRR